MKPLPLGHDDEIRFFLQQHDAGKLAHAWLLQGPKGIGKSLVAKALTRLIMSNQRTQGDIAQRLQQIATEPLQTLITNHSCPDLRIVEREKNDRGVLRSQITVEQVREVNSFLSHSRSIAKYKVVIIDVAEDMNRSAANAVLKNLEEPRPMTLIFLLSHAPQNLLPTIRSRCVTMTMKPLGKETFVKWAESQGIDEEQQHSLYTASRGRPGYANRLIEHDLFVWRESASSLLDHFDTADLTTIMTVAEPIVSKQKNDRHDWAGKVLLDIVVAKAKTEMKLFWAQAYQQIAQAIEDMNRLHLDRNLTLTTVLLKLQNEYRKTLKHS